MNMPLPARHAAVLALLTPGALLTARQLTRAAGNRRAPAAAGVYRVLAELLDAGLVRVDRSVCPETWEASR
jgi:Fe2+ or Zn2+ uptake regulation protein